ncbi:phosphomethylpyrimidine synthase ThiC [Shigella sonnei]
MDLLMVAIFTKPASGFCVTARCRLAVPIYQALEKETALLKILPWEGLPHPAGTSQQGVDYFTIDAGVRRDADDRETPDRIVAAVRLWRNGASPIIRENFLYQHFREICEICAAMTFRYRWRRPAPWFLIQDANDEQQFAEPHAG